MPVTIFEGDALSQRKYGLTVRRINAILMMALTLLFIPVHPPLRAAITGQIIGTYTITVSLADLGLSGTATAIATGDNITSIQPLDDTMINTPSSITIPVKATSYQKPLGTSYTTYFWRLRMNSADHTNWVNTQRTVSPTYTITSTIGNLSDKLSKTTSPTSATIPVSISTSQTQVFTNPSGNTWYLYQQSTLTIDLSNARYSGSYRGSIGTTLVY
jgi:hypothetical protein